MAICMLIWSMQVQFCYGQHTGNAISDTLVLKNYAIKTYSTNDGLPSNGTTCAITDRNGFLWIGTQNGLCRFDGYSLKCL